MGLITLHNNCLPVVFFLLLLLFVPLYLLCFVSLTVSKVDLGRIMKIRKVSMQGAKDGKGFIKSYTMSTRDDTSLPWRPFSQDNKKKVNLLKEAGKLVCSELEEMAFTAIIRRPN